MKTASPASASRAVPAAVVEQVVAAVGRVAWVVVANGRGRVVHEARVLAAPALTVQGPRGTGPRSRPTP